MKIKTGDNVVVMAGKNKKKTGKVIKVLTKTNKVVIEGVNLVKRHVKKTKQGKGQIISFEAPIHASNVMLIDSKTKKPTRIGYKMEGGKKLRVAIKSKSVIDDKKETKKDIK